MPTSNVQNRTRFVAALDVKVPQIIRAITNPNPAKARAGWGIQGIPV